MSHKVRQLLRWTLLIVGVIFLYQVFAGQSTEKEATLSYTALREKVAAKQVKWIIIEDGVGIMGELNNGERFRTKVGNSQVQAEIAKSISEAGVNLDFKTVSSTQWLSDLSSYAPLLAFVGVGAYLLVWEIRLLNKGRALGKSKRRTNAPDEAFAYDVALSFAGEDRNYVEEVAAILRETGIRVFYDKYEKAELWGKELYAHLTRIYQIEARYTVMFISEHYAKKLWTNQERKSAQARALTENREYILPARFDDTVISGILPTTGYISLVDTSPRELVDLIMEKIRLNISQDY